MSDKPSEEKLHSLYWEDYLSQSEIGEKYGVSNGTVSRWMREYGIETRTGGHRRSRLEHPVRLSRDTREMLREFSEKYDVTYDEALREVLPEDVDANVLTRDAVYIEVSDESHERLKELAGEGYSHSDVIDHFLRRETTTTALSDHE